MHGAKTGNSKDIQQIEEKHIKVEKSIENHEIPPKQDMVEIAGPMEEHIAENRQHVKDMIKRYYAHTTKAQEEAAVAANILQLLVDEVDEQAYVALVNAGTRPLNMMEMAQMSSQALEMKLERERQEKAENLRNQPIAKSLKNRTFRYLWQGGHHQVSCCLHNILRPLTTQK